MSNNTNESVLSPKFALALQFANEIHGKQTRKPKQFADEVICAPYISHLMAVSGLVLEYGGDETQAIAGLLHDAAEDCGGKPMLETVRVLFGEDVAKIVDACTDTMEEQKPKWFPRKSAYLAELIKEPGSAKLVSCADKLHNISHTLRDIRREGVKPWMARMKETKNGSSEKQCWYYLGCLRAFSVGFENPIRDEFARAVVLLCELVGTAKDIADARELAVGV